MLNVFQRVKEKRRDMAKYTVAVAGATGYAGGEALRILAAHPNFEVTCVAGHSSVGDKLGKHMPHIPQLADLVVEDTTPEVLNGHDVIILALPHGASGALASQLDPNAVVVDLGADHRLEEKSAWDAFYGGDFYQHWTYGMPELITGVAADGSYSRQRFPAPSALRDRAATSLRPRWLCNRALRRVLSNRKTSWLIWWSVIPAPARTSSAPICLRLRRLVPHCRIR